MNDEKTVLTAAKQYAWDFAQHTIHNTAETKAAADASLAALHGVIAKMGGMPADALRFGAQVIELYDDATMRDDDHMLCSTECAGILEALAGYIERFSIQPAASEAGAVPEWKRYPVSNVPHPTKPGMRVVGFLLPANEARPESVRETIERIIAAPAAQPEKQAAKELVGWVRQDTALDEYTSRADIVALNPEAWRAVGYLAAPPAPSQQAGADAQVGDEQVGAHADDAAVDKFAAAMKEKLAQARAKGRSGWQSCDPRRLSGMLRHHVEKGDPCDVANFCMFLWTLGEPITDYDKQPRLSTAAPAMQGDRAMLQAVMNDLDVSAWQCPKCGHAEDCKDMDAALMLRDYLAAAKPVAQGDEWRTLAACMYQAAGAFDMPVRFLDVLSAAADGEPFGHMLDGLLPVETGARGDEWADVADFSELIDDYQCAQRDGSFTDRHKARMALLNAYRAALARQQGGSDAKKERFDRLQDILAEYYKGCSNTLGEGPENCTECVCAFVNAVQRYADRQSGDAEDAARYRWLRDQEVTNGIAVVMKNKHIDDSLSCAENIDRFIDAARAQRAAAQGDA